MRIQPITVLCCLFIVLVSSNYSLCSTRAFGIGDQLSAQSVGATDGSTHIVAFDRPAVVVLWATWSPSSLTALSEIIKAAPQGGIRWQLLPINVDAPMLEDLDTARVHAAAKSAGWNGVVYHDRRYEIMDSWGILAIPTVMFTALGGAIEEVEHDWSPFLRDKLFAMYFGAITDSFPGIVLPVASARCRDDAAAARRLWRINRPADAITLMKRVSDSCVGVSSDRARLANWRWQSSDSIKARDQIRSSLRADEPNAWTVCADAAISLRLGDREAALDLSRKAAAMDSAFFPAWSVVAQAAWQTEDFALVENALQRMNTLYASHPSTLELGARLAERQGDVQRAVEMLRRAVEARIRLAIHP